MTALARGEELAQSENWKEAARAFEVAFSSGAGHIEARYRRALLALARGDGPGYTDDCRQLLRLAETGQIAPAAANDIAWVCCLGSGAVADYSPVVHLAELAAASRPSNTRLNTLGATLYRAGRFEEADRQLSRAVDVHGGGTALDALFLAMVQHQLGHGEEARRWLRLGNALGPDGTHDSGVIDAKSWNLKLELQILRREARAMIEPNAR
jgi:Flp pilus assembly protein TadD